MVVSLWITIGLIISASFVSTLGAYFSILGLGALFSGASVSIWIMAGSLELSKFVLAAYLHQTWKNLNILFKIYLTSSVVILSFITSIGVFGFLSDAYQSASTVLEVENIKIKEIAKKKETAENEIDRLNYLVEEVPDTRMTKKLQLRKEIEPKVQELQKQIAELNQQSTNAELNLVEVKKKVGPLLYIAKSFNVEIDSIVKYLIFIFVTVFDPLAICMVIAATYSLDSRRKKNGEVVAQNINQKNNMPDQLEQVFVSENKENSNLKNQNSIAREKTNQEIFRVAETDLIQSHFAHDKNNINNSVVVKMNFKTDIDSQLSSDSIVQSEFDLSDDKKVG